MKFDQLMKHNKRNFFFKNLAENEEERLVPDLYDSFLKKVYMK